ncbi:MAG: hypothetical protein RIS70_2326, partial [Planctomycetota bacterium]
MLAKLRDDQQGKRSLAAPGNFRIPDVPAALFLGHWGISINGRSTLLLWL